MPKFLFQLWIFLVEISFHSSVVVAQYTETFFWLGMLSFPKGTSAQEVIANFIVLLLTS